MEKGRRLKETGDISKSQNYGGMKDTRCIRCGMFLNNRTRIEQDAHEVECKKQKRIWE